MHPIPSKKERHPQRHPIAPRRSDSSSGRKFCPPATLLLAALIVANFRTYAADAPPAAVPAPTPAGTPTVPAKASLAKIQFATPVYDFGKVTAGDVNVAELHDAFTFNVQVRYAVGYENLGDGEFEAAS